MSSPYRHLPSSEPNGERANAAPARRALLAVKARVTGAHRRLHRWTQTGWATSSICAWAILQASLVPGPVETFYLPCALADRKRVWRFAGSAIAGSLLGALLAFGIGYYAFDSIGVRLLSFVGVDAGELARGRNLFASHGWLLVALSAVTPVSLKLSSIAAGAFGVPVSQFVLAVFAGRSIRFLASATVIYFASDLTRRWRRAKLEAPGPAGLDAG